MSHQISLPARLLSRLNPLLLFRSPSIYARIISQLMEMGHLPEHAEITLQGSGSAARKLKRKLGSSKIVLKGVRSPARSELEEAIKLAIAPRAPREMKTKSFRLRLETGALVIEPLGDDRARMKQKSDLRHYYEEETRKLIRLHQQKTPAAVSSDGATVSEMRRRLVERCVERAAEIAQEETAAESGVSSDRFALILCAGAVRGLSLASDVDFVLVSADAREHIRRSRYFDMLAERISTLLTEAGVRADNLVERFSPRKAAFIELAQTSEAVWLVHAAFDTKRVERVGSEEVYRGFRALMESVIYGKGALRLTRWLRLYLRQSLRKRAVKEGSLPDPSVWLRDITISYMLGSTLLISSHSESDSVLFDTFSEMEEKGLLCAAEKEEVIRSCEFFMKAANELFLAREGPPRAIAKDEASRISAGLGYQSGGDFLKAYREQANRVESLLRGMQERAGHGNGVMFLLDLWAEILLKARPFANLLMRGDAGVSISSGRDRFA